jgi:hypothetical protein
MTFKEYIQEAILGGNLNRQSTVKLYRVTSNADPGSSLPSDYYSQSHMLDFEKAWTMGRIKHIKYILETHVGEDQIDDQNKSKRGAGLRSYTTANLDPKQPKIKKWLQEHPGKIVQVLDFPVNRIFSSWRRIEQYIKRTTPGDRIDDFEKGIGFNMARMMDRVSIFKPDESEQEITIFKY